MMKILRINMRSKSVKEEILPQEWMLLGNRGLIDKIMLDEVPPTCEPLGQKNKLIFANGPLAMSRISSSGRISAGGKSPLTGGIKESNSGGISGYRMAQQGIRALIIEDIPEEKEALYLLHIHNGQAALFNAEEYKGLNTDQLTEKILEKYGKDCGVMCIGYAGEMMLSSAGIVNLDHDQNNSRLCARGGLGAVMGSKRLKAIVIQNDRIFVTPVADNARLSAAIKDYLNVLRTTPRTGVGYPEYGTAVNILTNNAMGAFPSYAFRSGSFEGVEEVSGEKLRDTILTRGGEGMTTHACMPGCIIRCSNVFADKFGKKVVASLEYETISLLGTNLGIGNLDDIAVLNSSCNNYGIDTIEVGAAIGVYMDLGLASFGDTKRAIELVNEIGQGTVLGRVLGEGSAITARIFKSLRAPTVKGQSMAAHEPRAIKGMSVTYATSPQGADHTAAVTTSAKIDHNDPTIQMEFSRNLQVKIASFDTLGFCLFASVGGPQIPGIIVEMINSIYGTNLTADFFTSLGKEVIWMEHQFNLKAGLNVVHDDMPEFMTEEPVHPVNNISDIPKDHYQRFWDESFWIGDK